MNSPQFLERWNYARSEHRYETAYRGTFSVDRLLLIHDEYIEFLKIELKKEFDDLKEELAYVKAELLKLKPPVVPPKPPAPPVPPKPEPQIPKEPQEPKEPKDPKPKEPKGDDFKLSKK